MRRSWSRAAAITTGWERRRQPGLRQLENTRLRERIRHEFARSRQTYGSRGGPIAPNRVRDLVVQRPDQLRVSDATGILTGQGWLYLVAVLDVFSRRVIGWAMSPILDAPLVSAALRMALHQRRPAPSLRSAAASSPVPLIASSWPSTAWFLP